MKEKHPGGTTGFVSRTIRGLLVIQSCSMDTLNPFLGESSKRWPGIPRSLSLILKNSASPLTDRGIISMIKWRSEFTAVTIYKASIQKIWKMLMLLGLPSKWKSLVSSYQNCYKTVKFILQPPASFPCSHCCPSTSVLVWQITCFLIAPSDCRINSILLNETFKVLCYQASPDFPRTPLLPNGSTIVLW